MRIWSMLTIAKLMEALAQFPPNMRVAQVRVATKTYVAERGPQEGAVVMVHQPVVGVGGTQQAIFLFIDQDPSKASESALPCLPKGFKTGNEEVDKRPPFDPEEGEGWKGGRNG